MNTAGHCSGCGLPHASGDTASGLCAACLLRLGVAGTETATAGPETPEHPERIGHYRILEPLGEGGMGVVYLAEQEEPVRRRVALKLIKWGMDTKHVVARFESERQALAS